MFFYSFKNSCQISWINFPFFMLLFLFLFLLKCDCTNYTAIALLRQACLLSWLSIKAQSNQVEKLRNAFKSFWCYYRINFGGFWQGTALIVDIGALLLCQRRSDLFSMHIPFQQLFLVLSSSQISLKTVIFALTDSQMAIWEVKNSNTAHELTGFAKTTWGLNKNFKKG